MKTVINDIIPFKGYKAMCFWPWIFVRRGSSFKDVDLNHELIHSRQQIEMLLVFFYLWYGIEYLFRLIQYRNINDAYRNISFEREAYANQYDMNYLQNRKHFAWIYCLTFKK